MFLIIAITLRGRGQFSQNVSCFCKVYKVVYVYKVLYKVLSVLVEDK